MQPTPAQTGPIRPPHRRTSSRRSASLRGRAAAVLAPALAAALALAAATPGDAAARCPAEQRGSLISAVPLTELTRAATADYLTQHGLPSPVPAVGTTTYRLVYRTVDAEGRPTTASGLLALPADGRRLLRVVAFEHGTMTARADAPSVGPDARAESLLFAGAGYATVAPDYLGLGVGPGLHPYADVRSETTASVDMLRAARAFAARQSRQLDQQVLITGFSQGGPAAMALGRALQSGADPSFRPAALAPISGPYDAQHAEMPAGLFTNTLDPKHAAYYFAYWVVSMNRLHHLYDNPAEVFQQPYATTVESLFDGNHSSGEVLAGIPDTPQQLLTPAFIEQAAHPSGALLGALRAQDTTCTDWAPRVPVRLYAASGDSDVTILNAHHCADALRSHGVDAQLLDVGALGHSPSKRASLPQIAEWFRSLLPAG
ncbi:alpha/beta hydrolase family protein [Kitasatospora sp. NPDC050543]|uniref:alpha/beta hydrolase family protein n=1 Tax=Kitasatospora sp. NPDC050543 TaxID=3364054 RepID=UPI00378EF5D3